MARGERLAILYDGDCGFCIWVLAWLLRWDRRRALTAVSIQSAEGERLLCEVAPERRLLSWHAREGREPVRSGGAALPGVLARLPLGAPLAALTSRFPRATEAAYGWVAANRGWLGRLVPRASKDRARALIALRMH